MTMQAAKFRAELAIDGRVIGDGHSPYVIAEVSGNHNKDINKALKMIEVAKACGADAVKFQTYTADSLTVPSDRPEFQITTGTWAGWNLHKLYQEAATPYGWFETLFAHGRKIGITVFSSPFDAAAVDLLESLDAPAYKIASNELTDWPLIEKAAATGKPLILSTGASSLADIEATVGFLERIGARHWSLLHCVSAYPAPLSDAHIANITELRRRFAVPIGFSDHTLDTTAAVLATGLGAAIIEKHFILDRSDGGPDSSFAIEPDELTDLVARCRQAFEAVGEASFGRNSAESKSPIFRRHFYATRDIAAGEPISTDNARAIRARDGIPACEFERLFGARARTPIAAFSPVTWEMLNV
tara:strand:- start:1069 stop:2142 length:1074 start_codon:yes stop_codon:yes gene_type:complete